MNRYLDYVKHSAQEDRDDYSAVEYSPNDLYHYGVLGMKWGVRKASPNGNLIDMIRRNRKMRNRQKNFMKAKRENSPAYQKMNSANKKGLDIQKQFIEKQMKRNKDLAYRVNELGDWDGAMAWAHDQLYEGKNANPEYVQAVNDYKRYRDEIEGRR